MSDSTQSKQLQYDSLLDLYDAMSFKAIQWRWISFNDVEYRSMGLLMLCNGVSG